MHAMIIIDYNDTYNFSCVIHRIIMYTESLHQKGRAA